MRRTTLAAQLFCMLVWAVVPALAQGEPEVTTDVQHDISKPLRELPAKHDLRSPHEKFLGRPFPGGLIFGSPEGALQTTVTPQVATTNGLNLLGVGVGFSGPQGSFSVNAAPPDTNGAVGATQFVEWVNSSFAVFDKNTGAVVYGPAAGNTLWTGFGGPCETNNDGDPIAQYDKAANRWVLTQFAVPAGGPFLQCVAVSATSDATGSYFRYAFTQPNFNDYPKLGVWPDAYYVTFNLFSGNTFVGARACAFDRSRMLIGASATQVCFDLGTSFAGLLPSDLDGATPPPAGSPNFLLNFGSNSLNLWRFHVDFNTPTNSTLTGPVNISVAGFSPACNGGTCIRQPGTRQQLDSLADRLMYRLGYRNFGDHESLVVNHSVTAGSSVGIRWYELRSPAGTPAVFQQGTYAPDSNFRWMGSIAMDKAGDIAVGYSVSSSSVFPSISFTGRVPTDALGTLQPENSIQAGAGSQLRTLNRWGDYSSMSVDPVDDCTFWYANEYLQSSGTFNWSTRIASFKFPGCSTPATPDFSLSASPSSQTVAQGAATSYTVTVTPSGGFSGTVNFGVTGLPSGATANFNPASVTGSGSTTLSVNTSSTTPAGTYTLTITGTSGTLSHSTTVTLTVQGPNPDFTISATPASQTVPRAGNTSYTVTVTQLNGFSGTVSFSVAGLPSRASASFNPTSVVGSGSSSMTVTTNRKTPTGTSVLTITGSSGTLSHSTTVSLTVQ